jgi:hypothetical protein
MEARELGLALEEAVRPGVNVCTIVVGTRLVVVTRTVERTVETIVEAGT